MMFYSNLCLEACQSEQMGCGIFTKKKKARQNGLFKELATGLGFSASLKNIEKRRFLHISTHWSTF